MGSSGKRRVHGGVSIGQQRRAELQSKIKQEIFSTLFF